MGLSWGRTVAAFQQTAKDAARDNGRETEKIVDDVGRLALRDARSGTPVKSGRLRAGWELKQRKSGENRVDEIENNVSYGAAVEYGTSKTKPRRMLAKAMRRARARLMKRLKRNLNRISNGFNR